MSVLKEGLQKRLNSFYEQSPAEQQATLRLILDEAARDPSEFISLLQQEEFDGLNNLPFFYEALSLDLENWANFFLEEAKRLLRLAKASAAPATLLTHFAEFDFIKPERFQHRLALLNLLASELQNPNPVFRFHLMDTVEALATSSDLRAIELLTALANDKNWRIRYKIHLIASDSLILNKIELSLLDRARSKLLRPFDIA